jgi:glutamate 5-kinase
MVTKLQAADLARHSGTTVVIARGSEPDVLLRLANGMESGTRLLPVINKLEGRKRYIISGGHGGRTSELIVDTGAARALAHGGSLLPAGLTQVIGNFERGDTVRVAGPDGNVIATGLVSYASLDLVQLCGKQSTEIESILGYSFGDEVIHRNNMVLV